MISKSPRALNLVSTAKVDGSGATRVPGQVWLVWVLVCVWKEEEQEEDSVCVLTFCCRCGLVAMEGTTRRLLVRV
jgi:hypothetical protein